MVFAPVDICFLILILVFAVLALLKGFIKEIFGKVSVIGGLACSIVFSPRLTPYVEDAIHNKIVAVILSFLLVFVAVFLMICIVQRIFEKIFSGEIMRGLDRVLGFLLGAAEGVVIILFLMVIVTIQPWFDTKSIIDGSLFFSMFSSFIDSSAQYIKGMAVV
ncbi:MAG: CvpA family protein [Treponema sp.]|nr:CvpA family protein [Treponema sp.]